VARADATRRPARNSDTHSAAQAHATADDQPTRGPERTVLASEMIIICVNDTP
jgi:hypothetical protein